MKNLFSDIEKMLTADVITNELLKNIIDKIVVCENGEIKVYMKILGNFEVDASVPICNVGTQRRNRPPDAGQPGLGGRGKEGSGRE